MTDKAKAAIATLENLGYTHEGGILWKPPLGKAPDFNLLDTLHARIASLEAQLSARQDAPDGWRLVPVASTAAMEWAFRSAEVRYSNGAGRMLPMDPHSAFKAQYRDMLSAAPPPPEREPKCWCETCRPVTLSDMRMVLCPDCGNKRCPKATHHDNACTNSNAPGQPGSSWEHVKPHGATND
ncbi:hypothetical protein [Comamonas sp.]|uniref:hypothetical protein n=1 Tax=Comamonas sp. TaxID=34028 RepID=UPI003D126AF8